MEVLDAGGLRERLSSRDTAFAKGLSERIVEVVGYLVFIMLSYPAQSEIHQLAIIQLNQLEAAMQMSTVATELRNPRKTRKGWLGNKVTQIHLRNDVPCGFQLCPEHGSNNPVFHHDPSSEDTLYFLDTQTLIEQTDILYNCAEMRNVVILQSSIEELKKKSLNKYNAFKNFLEVEEVGEKNQNESEDKMEVADSRSIFILADLYQKTINQQIALSGFSDSEKEFGRLATCIEWYRSHTQQIGLPKINLVLLTLDQAILKSEKICKGVEIRSIIDYLKQSNSNLLDFVGFADLEDMEQEPIFQDHIDVKEAKKLIREGKLFEGKYMDGKSYFKIGHKMYKLKTENNRAIFGDVVAYEIAPIEQWENKTVVKTISDLEKQEIDLDREIEQQPEVTTNLIKTLDSNPNLVPKGRIRAIIKRNVKDYCGGVDTTHTIKESPNGWKMFEFNPADDRFPLFYIRTYNAQSIHGKRIQVSYDSWPANSKYPLCHFLRVIGDAGNARTEGDVILLEHNVEIKEFSRKAYECLPPAGQNFSIPASEEAYRLDLRHIEVCSIDPPGCKDIDDALHCITLPNGNLQIGVHIADVSYYVRPDSALDMEARNRCTTVYLVDRRTDMLPKLLTENLCSLRANVDRLAFSTIWEVDQEGTILNTQYCKTIICSRQAFTYMEAQELMDSNSTSTLAESIRNLNRIAKKLKAKRLSEGALTLASTQVKITLEEETHSATDVQLYHMVEANYLIEEFMLLANISVARKVYERFPAVSILRRHTSPKLSELETLKEILSLFNYDLKFESSKALADSLDTVQKQGDPFFNKLIRILTTRCMNEATYFCSADFDPQEFHHYGLAADFYTHFTSPIRRYADVLVHRLLAAAIDLEPLPHFMGNKIKMTKICDKMNMRNRMARYASRASSDYHTYQFFKGKEGTQEKGVILEITEVYISVMLIKYGLECKYLLSEQDSRETVKLNKGKGVFNKCIIKGVERTLFSYAAVSVHVEMLGFHKKISLQLLS